MLDNLDFWVVNGAEIGNKKITWKMAALYSLFGTIFFSLKILLIIGGSIIFFHSYISAYISVMVQSVCPLLK